MPNLLINLFSIFLVMLSICMVLIILMQRANTNSGLGTAMGGGVAESALGAGANKLLTRITIYISVLFFILTFSLYLSYMNNQTYEDTTPILPNFDLTDSTETILDFVDENNDNANAINTKLSET